MKQDLGALSGSREPSPSSTGLGPSGVDPARLRLERYDKISTRILDGDGRVVSMIEQLSNGRWIVADSVGQVAPRSFGTVRLAFAWFRSRILDAAIATEAHRAETVQLGSVHEGAGPQDIAQGSSQ